MGTYEVLPLSEVCRQVGLKGEDGKAKGKRVLKSMIEEQEIHASLQEEQGEEIVTFDRIVRIGFGATIGIPSGEEIQALAGKTKREASRVATLERDLLLSKEFLTKVSRCRHKFKEADSNNL